jgi:hypothetical protein
MNTKKGELSLQVIVIAVVCLVVLVILIVIVAGRSSKFVDGSQSAEEDIIGNPNNENGDNQGQGMVCSKAFPNGGICSTGGNCQQNWIDCGGSTPCCMSK